MIIIHLLHFIVMLTFLRITGGKNPEHGDARLFLSWIVIVTFFECICLSHFLFIKIDNQNYEDYSEDVVCCHKIFCTLMSWFATAFLKPEEGSIIRMMIVSVIIMKGVYATILGFCILKLSIAVCWARLRFCII